MTPRPTVTADEVEKMDALGVDVLLLVQIKTKAGKTPEPSEYATRIAPALAALKRKKWDKIATFINEGL